MRGKADGDRALYPDGVTFLASGFWVQLREGHHAFCTNKHNVVPSLKRARLHLASLEIEVRGADDRTTSFHTVRNAEAALWVHPTADCAAMINPDLDGLPEGAKRMPLPEQWVAGHDHFARLQLADEAFFLGFPSVGGHMWFDESAALPIARNAVLASIPSQPFVNAAILTSDVLMLAGLSFAGSSGSIVINRRQGVPPGGDIHDPSHVPSQIVGVMSGHFSEPSPEQPMPIRHGGLSYMTRSTAMLEVFEMARAGGFGRQPPP
jgi:hypothetical protein